MSEPIENISWITKQSVDTFKFTWKIEEFNFALNTQLVIHSPPFIRNLNKVSMTWSHESNKIARLTIRSNRRYETQFDVSILDSNNREID